MTREVKSGYTDEDIVISKMLNALKHYEAIFRDPLMRGDEGTEEAYRRLEKAFKGVIKAEARVLLEIE